ncbi:sulfurtransferase TusA family protein [Vibrio sp. CAU 1672]|uniref:sulfurtransferase TusA family protein n=1 Tax=Vibrio sp. CAU 1672 TaxID=3032594 RepID=UPI0023DAB0B5|nr:sulfurtransferase TusA family protein [Vibrio sp. CAU 1672]MDF2155501.1 sulfurtransferase TusA family protein [Vibrio sp. CAU 1672]
MLVDLRMQRCPMALLLAKRHLAKAFKGKVQHYHELVIQVTDSSSKQDIVKYLHSQGYVVHCESQVDYFSLTVLNKESL